MVYMSDTRQQLVSLIQRGEIRVSEHGHDEMANDGISARDAVSGFSEGVAVEDYPKYHKGPCVLMLQRDSVGNPIHVVWGIPKGKVSPAVLVTAYRPDKERWAEDFMRRRQ